MYNNTTSSPTRTIRTTPSTDSLLSPPTILKLDESIPIPPGGVAISTQRNVSPVTRKTELKHPAGRNWLIHLHYVRREFSTCKSIITEELVRLNGESQYANYIMALILRGEGKMQESLDRLQICHKLEPTDANIVNQIARSLFLLGRHKLAINAYKKAQVLNDEIDWETNYNMGLSYLYLNDFSKVKEHMNLSLQSRVSQEAFQVLARIALLQDNLKEAISAYEKGLRIFPDSPELLSSLGVLYMKAGRTSLCFEKFGSSLAFDSVNSRALVGMASLMQTYEDYDFALSKYKTAMQSLPDSSSLLNNVGMCFFGKKKFVASISCLKRAYYLSAFDWKTLHNLGLVHLHMQQYASAFHFLTAAINLKPDEAHNFVLLAVTISHLDEIEHAKQAYDQAIRLYKQNPTTDIFKLHLNYSVSLFNHRMFQDSYTQLMSAQVVLEKMGADKVDNETKDLFNRVKTSLRMMDYNFPEMGALKTTVVSVDHNDGEIPKGRKPTGTKRGPAVSATKRGSVGGLPQPPPVPVAPELPEPAANDDLPVPHAAELDNSANSDQMAGNNNAMDYDLDLV